MALTLPANGVNVLQGSSLGVLYNCHRISGAQTTGLAKAGRGRPLPYELWLSFTAAGPPERFLGARQPRRDP